MTLGEIEKLLNEKEKTKEEQIRIIRKERGRLLEEIHGKQQLLDRLDYMLHEMKKINRRILRRIRFVPLSWMAALV